MDNLVDLTTNKVKQWSRELQTNSKMQLAVLSAYLLFWLFSSGSLSKTIWVMLGVALGWIIGKNQNSGA